MLTAEHIQLVQTSFVKVRSIADTAAALFYQRLFELEPAARALFNNDMQVQGRKLMETLVLVVEGLPILETITPAVQDLARRHVAYGVRAEHYEVVGQALLWALAQGLGADFTPEVQNAWGTVYTTVATIMKEAAYH